MYSRQEENVLSFVSAPLYQKRITNFKAVNASHEEQRTGKRLPVQFHGSPSSRKRSQLDAMSVVSRKGKPYLMVTFTCNGNWPEIQENLLPGQCALDRPDLCNRVFHIVDR